jgi:ribonuclease R
MKIESEEHKETFTEIARKAARDEGFVLEFPAPEPTLPYGTNDEDARDQRDLLWSSIDNQESTDLDQVEVSDRLADGTIRVRIAIADVDELLPAGTALDAHAAWNTCSLYAGPVNFPMLPDDLSSGATSLLPGLDRLAIVTQMDVAPDGHIAGVDVYRAWVCNRAKLVYDEVGAWLEKRGPSPEAIAASPALEDQVRMQDEAAQRLRRRRIEHGALELETPEARAVTKDGEVVALKLVTTNRARTTIEDLMIAANGAAARFLEDRRVASIRRVVRAPRRWDRIVELAATRGTTLPATPEPVALSTFLHEQRAVDRSNFAELSLSVVKLLGPGEYAVADPESPDGHFGLAVDDYAHSTAPNRRYGDLVTQRILKATAKGAPQPYDVPTLWKVAKRCTEVETHARSFERTMRKVAAALFLSKRIGDTFEAVVTGRGPKGVFVRLLDPPAEGRVVKGEGTLDVGDHTRVRLVATEPTRGFIDFVVAPNP